MATPLEIEIDQYTTGPAADPQHPITRTLTGKRKAKYTDLGPVPKDEEKLEAIEEGDDDDEDDGDGPPKRPRTGNYMPSSSGPAPPPPTRPMSSTSSSSSPSSSSLPSRPRTASREGSDRYKAMPHRLDRDSDKSRSDRRVQRRAEADLFGPDDDEMKNAPLDVPVPINLEPFLDSNRPPETPPYPPHLPLPFDHMIPPAPADEAVTAEPQLEAENYKPLNTPPELQTIDSKDELLYAQHFPVDPTANAQASYAYYLTEQSRRNRTTYQPRVPFAPKSKTPKELRKGQWKDHVFCYSIDVNEDDLEFFRVEGDQQKIAEHFAHMTADAKRHAEVNLKQLTQAEKKEFDAAKAKELDQWVSNSV